MLSDPSAIALIVGAIAIIGFLVHGLWFSGRPANRKLNMKNREDQELSHREEIAKVRIVSYDKKVVQPTEKAEPEEVSELTFEVDDSLRQDKVREREFPSSIELNLLAPKDRPYQGEDLEALCRQYGILRGDLDIFYVYENLQTRTDEVFRICSLVSPFSFPKAEKMANFSTPALALYMNVPSPGKAVTYVRALIMAAKVFVDNLGGEIRDIHHNILNAESLAQLEELMQRYDEQGAVGKHD